MKIKEFQAAVARTMSELHSPILNSVHMVLGMCTEINDELIDAIENNDETNIGEEIGDAEWYVGNYANIWKIDLPNEISFEPEVYMDIDASKTIAKLQDLDKKELAYGKIAPIEERSRLINLLLVQLEGLAFAYGIDTDVMRAKIVAKLKARYPDNFNSEQAINRDLKTERKILES